MPVFRSELLAIKTLRGGVSMKFRAAFSEGPEPSDGRATAPGRVLRFRHLHQHNDIKYA